MAAASLATASLARAAVVANAPMVCSRGPATQIFVAMLTLPRAVARGSRYSVRIDSGASGEISHFGLHYIHDMQTDYVLPSGATYVDGSARIVPGTGTSNVATTARVTHQPGVIRVVLPGHVVSGSSFTPPSIEFQLDAVGRPGTSLPIAVLEYRVSANAMFVGEVQTTCVPMPRPCPLAATLITAPTP